MGTWAHGWQNSFVPAEQSHLNLQVIPLQFPENPSETKLAGVRGCWGAQLSCRETGCSFVHRWKWNEDYCCKLPGKCKYRCLQESLSTFFFFQEVLVALSSTNYKFPNPRHLGASLKQGLFMLRLVVNCNSLESGRFVSQSSSRDCSCQWHLFGMLLPSTFSYFKMGNSFHRLPKGLAGGVTRRRQNSLACGL